MHVAPFLYSGTGFDRGRTFGGGHGGRASRGGTRQAQGRVQVVQREGRGEAAIHSFVFVFVARVLNPFGMSEGKNSVSRWDDYDMEHTKQPGPLGGRRGVRIALKGAGRHACSMVCIRSRNRAQSRKGCVLGGGIT